MNGNAEGSFSFIVLRMGSRSLILFTVDMSKPYFFFFSSRSRHTRSLRDWSSDVCSSDLGLSDGDTVRGRIPLLVNAFASRPGDAFEPVRAETPAPIPTWAWVLVLLVGAWGMWYAATDIKAYQEQKAATALASSQASSAPGRPGASQPSWAALGEQVYGNKCAACHQLTGEGLPGVFPPLKGSTVVTSGDPTEHIRTVLRGLAGKAIGGVAYAATMPAFADQLSDEEVAAVLSHERTSWGNQAPPVKPEDVIARR